MSVYFSRGRNQITSKPLDIFVYNKLIRSETLAEAHQKQLKFYRDACRRMPFILQSSSFTHHVHPVRARLNLACHLRKHMHVRNVGMIDEVTTDMYEWLYDTVWNYNHIQNFENIVVGKYSDASGYSYLDEKRYAKCSPFLKDFFKGVGRPSP